MIKDLNNQQERNKILVMKRENQKVNKKMKG